MRVHQRGGCHPIPSHYDGGLLHQGIEYRLSPHQHSSGQRAQRHLYTHTGKGECGDGISVTIIKSASGFPLVFLAKCIFEECNAFEITG